MEQSLIENEIKCKIHGEKIVLYSEDECENFESRLFCLLCFNNRLPPRRLLNFSKIIEQMNQYKQEKVNSANEKKQQIMDVLEQFYKQFLLFKESLEYQLHKIQIKYQEWISQIKNHQVFHSDKSSLLKQLESFSKEQYLNKNNQDFKKEILEINISQYQQMYKLLDDFNFLDNQDQLKGMLLNVIDKFYNESEEGKQYLKPIQYYQLQNPFINLVCREHNKNIQNIDLEKDTENDKQRLKCSECRVGKAVSVDQFFKVFQQQQEEIQKVVKNKRKFFLNQLDKVKQTFIEVSKKYFRQLKQFIEELDQTIIREVNQQTLDVQKQVECLKEEDIIQMIYQILNCDNTIQELKDLESRQSATNSIIIKNSTQINEIIITEQSFLIELIKQTSDELEQQTNTYQEKQRQISDFLVLARGQDQKEVQKEDQIKQSIIEVKQELLGYDESSFEQLEKRDLETKLQFEQLVQEKLANQDQSIKKLNNLLDQSQQEIISQKSSIQELSQQSQVIVKREQETQQQFQQLIQEKFQNQNQLIDQSQQELLKQKFSLEQLLQQINTIENQEKNTKSSIEQLYKLIDVETTQKLNKLDQAEQKIQQKLENYEQRVEKIKNILLSEQINYKLVDFSQVQDNYSNSNYFPYGMTFNYKGDLLISSYNNQIQIRGFKNQALTGVQSTLQAQSNCIYVIVSSRKYNWFFTGGNQGYISSYKEVNGQWQATHQKEHTSYIYGILLNKEENQLVTCSADKSIKIWKIDYNTNSIALEYTLEQKHNHYVYCICFNFNESQIVSASNDKLIIIWEKVNNNKWSFKQQINNQYIGYRVQFISDTQFAFTVQEKGIIQVFNQVNGQYTEIQQVQLTYNVSDGYRLFNSIYLQQQQVLISKHNKYVYFMKKCNIDGKLKIISKPIDSLHYYTFGAVTQDGQYLLLENAQNGQYRVYALECLSIGDI